MKRKQTHIKYGLISGIAMSLVYFIVYQFRIDDLIIMRYLGFVPFLVGIIMNAMAYSKANDGKITFANAFNSCYKATLVVTLISVVWIVISIKLFPSMEVKYMEKARESIVKNPSISDESIAASIAFMKRAYPFMMIFFTAVYGLVAGLVFSLIGGAVAPKNKMITAE